VLVEVCEIPQEKSSGILIQFERRLGCAGLEGRIQLKKNALRLASDALTGVLSKAIFITGKHFGSVPVPQPPESATQLLFRWRRGDREALRVLIPLVYQELRQAAHRALRSERSGHTLQSTALVHEVYLRLAGGEPPAIENRAHFVAIAAKLMRQVLVDYARRRGAAKRGPEYKVELHESFYLPQKENVDIVALDHALARLSQRDKQQEKIVELRFFGGLTVEETAQVLEISPATVKRDWSMAKAWLTREVGRSTRGEDPAMGAGEGTI
jgi:RNA polymerase sigma factor (TIGR02999 family)